MTSPATGLRAALEEAMQVNGYTMKDLTVLAPQNDPFRVDTPAGHRDGAWLASKLPDGRTIHIRGLHYIVIGQIKSDGKPYTNTEEDWLWLSGKAAKAARWLGYVPFDRIIDNRNAEPVVRIWEPRDPWPFVNIGLDIEIPHVEDIEPAVGVGDFTGTQPYKLVLFGEKASLEPVLAPIAAQREADLYLPTGEASDTMIHQMASIGAQDGRPMIVFYLSDCDPAGWQMAVSVARKLQALRELLYPGLEFEVRPVALTPDQVRQYDLPSAPLKATEKRADRWMEAMGVQQTEIDAIATLQPDLLDRLVRQAIKLFYDTTLDDRVRAARENWQEEAQRQLDSRADQGELDHIRAEAADKLGALEREIEALKEKLHVDIDPTDLPPIEIPEANITAEPSAEPLISSDWDYIEATKRLKAHKAYQD